MKRFLGSLKVLTLTAILATAAALPAAAQTVDGCDDWICVTGSQSGTRCYTLIDYDDEWCYYG